VSNGFSRNLVECRIQCNGRASPWNEGEDVDVMGANDSELDARTRPRTDGGIVRPYTLL